MLKIIKVTGDSLTPDYQDGDFVVLIAKSFLFNRLNPGDTVVFIDHHYGMMIKKIRSIEFDQIFVIGTHIDSVDSKQLGPINRDRLIGKVIWHIASVRQ